MGILLISVNCSSSCGFLLFCTAREEQWVQFPLFGGLQNPYPKQVCAIMNRSDEPNCCLSKNSTSRWHTLLKVAQPCFPLVILMIHSPMGRWISAIVTVLLFLITRGITSSFRWFLSLSLSCSCSCCLPVSFSLNVDLLQSPDWGLVSSSWKRTRRGEGKRSTFTC